MAWLGLKVLPKRTATEDDLRAEAEKGAEVGTGRVEKMEMEARKAEEEEKTKVKDENQTEGKQQSSGESRKNAVEFMEVDQSGSVSIPSGRWENLESR